MKTFVPLCLLFALASPGSGQVSGSGCCPTKTVGAVTYGLLEEGATPSDCSSPCIYTSHLPGDNKRYCFAPGNLTSVCTLGTTPTTTTITTPTTTATTTTVYSGPPVSCGNHDAASCGGCPQGHGEGWCNGDCQWIEEACVASVPGTTPTTTTITTPTTTDTATTVYSGVELRGGSNPAEGNVFVNGKPVCDDSWGSQDAGVVCRMLGYVGGAATSRSQFGIVPTDWRMDNVECSGTETDIRQCPAIRNCGSCGCLSSEGAGVICETTPQTTTATPTPTPTTTATPTTSYSGPQQLLTAVSATMSSTFSGDGVWLAEMCIDGVLTGINDGCHTNRETAPWLALDFGANTQIAVDRVIIHNRDGCCGEKTKNAEIRVADVLPESGQVMFSGGELVGTFTGPGVDGQVITLTSSTEIGGRFVIIQLDHSQEANVLNLNEVTVWGHIKGVELRGGSNSGEGNVFINGKPVCDDSWDSTDAGVVCRMLGYVGGAATSQSQFGIVPTDWRMDDVECSGTETDIRQCPARRNCGSCGCSSDEGAGVICDVPEQGTLSSPNYPDTYDNNLDRNYMLEVSAGNILEITFVDFDLEFCGSSCSCDTLMVTDGDGTTLLPASCGNTLPNPITSNTNRVDIGFQTDFSSTRGGFHLTWRALPDPGQQTKRELREEQQQQQQERQKNENEKNEGIMMPKKHNNTITA